MRLHFGEYTLDEDRRELLRGEEPVHLSPKAFRLLQLLANRHPNSVSKEEIFDAVWPGTFVADSNLPIVVKDIRAALGDDARRPRIVRTVFGHGYALAAAVTKEESSARSAVNSIAVLPLTNAAGAEWDYVAEGISENIINSLARLQGLRVVPRSTSFRQDSNREMPEAEWECAARGGAEGKFYPWGDEPPQSRTDYEARWLSGPEQGGRGAPNGYGLYDMCENVHEWCSDWYGADYYGVSPERNPPGPEAGSRRVSRGGSWRHRIKISRCAARSSIPPAFQYSDYGFRIACRPE